MAGRVLCADADPRVSKIFRESLQGQGYEVEIQQDGQGAFERLADDSFDLALIDVQLPMRDGFEVLEEIRRQPSPMCDIPVFLLTSTRITPAYKQRARRAGATAMLVKPVPLARLHRLIRKHIKEGPPRVESAEPVAGSTRSLPFEGDFRELDFPALLHHLHGRRESGVLVLTNAGRRKVIELREGQPASVKSNLIGECLGNRLVERGLISQQVFDESVARMKSRGELQGEILIAMRAMDEVTIAKALVEQAEEKLLEIFSWKRGHYEFKPAAQLRRGLALPRDRSPSGWLLRGIRERMAIETIDYELRSRSSRAVSLADSARDTLQDAELDALSRALLDRVGDAASVGALIDADEATRRALYGLIVTGLVETRSRASRRARASSKERELRAELAAAAERLRQRDDFEVLGLVPGASTDAVEAAFAGVARRSHPDRFKNNSAAVRSLADGVFARFQSAYERLRDPRRRGGYELELRRNERRKARAREEEREIEAEVEFREGEALLRSRSYEAALLCFGKALERKHQEGEYHAHYGWCLYLIHPTESAMVEEAIEHVRRGLKLARDHDKPYLFLGRLYKATGNISAAEKMFMRAVEIRPESVEAVRELRLINMRRGKQGLIGRILRR